MNKTVAIILGVVGVVGVLGLCCAGVGVFFILGPVQNAAKRTVEIQNQKAQQEAPQPQPQPQLQPQKKGRRTREELAALLQGKTTEEVKTILGPPQRTNNKAQLSFGEVWEWTYNNLTYDAVSGRNDISNVIEFRNGTVHRVNAY